MTGIVATPSGTCTASLAYGVANIAQVSNGASGSKRIKILQSESATAVAHIHIPMVVAAQPEASTVFRAVSQPYFIMTIETLNDVDFDLRKPVPVEVHREVDGFTVSNTALNVHAFGRSPEEAIQDWKDTLIDLFVSYSETPERNLAPSGKKMRDRLASVVFEL